MMDQWWKVHVRPLGLAGNAEELESLCFDLIEHGAVTTSVDDAPSIHCFLSGSEATARAFADSVTQLGVETLGLEEIEPQNWNDRCLELWEPVTAGGLEIVPVESPDDGRPYSPKAIRIIPGEGFGTGHHPTTRMILEELSELADDPQIRSGRVLDVGTGSGILAIAAARILDCPVWGNDIDPHALNNARDNLALNGVSDSIHLTTADVHELAPGFTLILANLYGEVLVQLAPAITSAALPNTVALLSGITELVKDPVIEAYMANGSWRVRRERNEGHWVCLVLERV